MCVLKLAAEGTGVSEASKGPSAGGGGRTCRSQLVCLVPAAGVERPYLPQIKCARGVYSIENFKLNHE